MRCRSLLKLAICFALVPMLAGCAKYMGKLAVDLTALKECRKLTPHMTVSQIGQDTDYRALSAESGGTIQKGNKAIDRRDRCDDKVIDNYAEAARE
jgi:hypothetical protein